MDARKHDADPQETREWLDALSAVIGAVGLAGVWMIAGRLLDATQRRAAWPL